MISKRKWKIDERRIQDKLLNIAHNYFGKNVVFKEKRVKTGRIDLFFDFSKQKILVELKYVSFKKNLDKIVIKAKKQINKYRICIKSNGKRVKKIVIIFNREIKKWNNIFMEDILKKIRNLRKDSVLLAPNNKFFVIYDYKDPVNYNI